MKKLVKILLILTVFLASSRGIFAATGINERINFQGKVVNKGVGGTDGTNVTDNSYDFQFTIWNTLSGGSSIWTETWNSGTSQVAVNNGIFAVVLGTFTSLAPVVDFNNPNIYLSVNYNHDGDMTPRIQVAAVPYAFNAEKVNGLTVTNTTGVLSIGNSKTVTFGDNFTTIAGVGITLNQSLATTDSPTFAGLSIGGTISFTNTPVSVGTTVLFIDANGKLTKGYMAQGTGTTYAFVNGLTDPGTHVIGLGGTLTANTQIGVSSFGLAFTNSAPILYLSSGGLVGVGFSAPAYQLDVSGDINTSGRIGIGGTDALYSFHTTGNGRFDTNLSVGGSLSFSGVAVGTGTTVLMIAANGTITQYGLGSMAFDSGTYDNYQSWYLRAGGIGVAQTISSTNYADFYGMNGIGTSVSGNDQMTIGLGGSLVSNVAIGLSSSVFSFVGSSQSFVLASSGYVGIGGTNPLYSLNVGGTANFTNLFASAKVGIGTTAPGVYLLNVGGTSAFTDLIIGGLVGIGNSSPGVYKLNVGGTAAFSGLIVGGPTGIGTSSPGVYQLNVGGTANFINLFTTGNVSIGASITAASLPVAVGTSIAYLNSSGFFSRGLLGPFDNYQFWGVQANSGNTTPVTSGLNVNFINGVGISISQVGTSLTISNLGTGVTYGATNGLNLSATSYIGLGGTLSQLTKIDLNGNNMGIFGTGYFGIGTTNPSAVMEINSNLTGSAGLKFTQITSNTSAGASTNKVLTVDTNGNVYLAPDNIGYTGAITPGTMEGQTLRFGVGTSAWQVSNFLFNNDVSIGMGTTSPTAALDVNGVGVTNLFNLSYNGVSKVTVSNSGTIQVKGSTSDDVKTSTGTGTATDFEGVTGNGSTMVNTVSESNLLDMAVGAIPNSGMGSMAMTSIATTAPVGPGGQVIIREDGQYVIIGGTSSALASVWPGTGTTMAQITVAVGATMPGAGAIALRRPDRKYLLIHGNNSGYSSVFDPFNLSAAVTGPPMFGGVTVAAGAGTNAYQRSDGRYVVIGGGTTAWGLYDPSVGSTGVYIGGTGVPVNFGAGAHFLLRDDGNAIVYPGIGAGNTNVYFYDNTGYMGSLPLSPAGLMLVNPMGTGVSIPTMATAGAFSIRMQNGKYLTLDGGVTSSWIYDASVGQYGTFSRQIGVGMGTGESLADGAMAIWRSDGKYLLFVGSGSTTTYIVDPSVAVGSTMFSLGPTLPAVGGLGMTPFMGPDGKYYVVMGAGKSMAAYDMGYVMGGQTTGVGSSASYYLSEPINTGGNLNVNSALNWNINTEGAISFFARTGIGLGITSATFKPILRSGDSIGAGSSDTYVQIKIGFQRSLPTFLDQEWGVRKGNQTRYRRNNSDPVVFDYTVDNSQSVHRSQFDFGESSNGSGPVQTNLINNSDRNLGLSLATQQNSGGVSAATSSIFLGAFGSHSTLGVAVSQTTVVMRRPNGQYTVLIGGTLPYSAIYDPNLQTFSIGVTPTVKVGAGALAFKRPDGKFLVVMGDGASTTNIYDPVADSYTLGPYLTDTAGLGAMVLPLPNGRVLIVHGNFKTTSSIYDPFMNTMVPGVQFTSWVGLGSLNIPRPDGSFLVVLGAYLNCSTLPTTTNIFNPYTMTVGASSPPVSITAGTSVGPGSLAIPRTDGNWLIVMGAGTSTGTGTAAVCTTTKTTFLYNPAINRTQAGPPLVANAGYGAHAIPRADGRWLIVSGANTSATNIYDQSAGGTYTADIGIGGTFIAGPTTVGNVGGVGTTLGGSAGGSISFQRDDGKFVTIMGSGGTGVNQADALWVDKGIYKSEEMYVSDLDSNSTLTWKASPTYSGITGEIKTAPTQNGIQTASGKTIASPGTLINPGATDKWVQVTFNFKRSFPSYGGIVNDVWYNSGSPNIVTNRTISTPILNEFTITKDVNLINLQADGMSVFRVSSNGNVYTSGSGVVNSGGADLAENYTSDQDLQKGEVVSIDPTNNHAVQRSKFQYEPDLVGVVSTDPGFVAGAFTENSYPIALVGRVPVKVSTENGPINIGDRLTSSSTPGYAMKAVKAGRVIGKALEALDTSTLRDCPTSDFGNQGQKCGSVMTFVNLSDYLGMPVEMAMAQSNKDIGANVGSSVPGWMSDSDEKILQYLSDNKESTAAAQPSDVFADRVVSTKIVADTIIANKIKANSIEGLEVFTNQIGSLNDKYNQLASQVAGAATASAVASISPTNPLAQIFNFNGQSQFSGNLLVKALTEFWDKVLFKEEVTFQKTPVFNKEMAGFAIIDAGQTGVEVKFDQAYAETPVINVTMVVEDGQEQAVLDQNYVYFVAKKSQNGFTIRLNKTAADKVQFSWSALAIKDAKTVENQISVTPVPSDLTPTITGIPTITIIPTETISSGTTVTDTSGVGGSAVTN